MLIICIGHGHSTDEYSCSFSCDRNEADPNNLTQLLNACKKYQKLEKDWIDEILVVENDDVINHLTWENGLG